MVGLEEEYLMISYGMLQCIILHIREDPLQRVSFQLPPVPKVCTSPHTMATHVLCDSVRSFGNIGDPLPHMPRVEKLGSNSREALTTNYTVMKKPLHGGIDECNFISKRLDGRDFN